MSVSAHPCGLINKCCIEKLATCKKEVLKTTLSNLSKITPRVYVPRAIANACVEAYGKGTGHEEVTKDGEQAVLQAAMYVATRDETYAKNSVAIIQAWATTCKSFEGSNAPLELAWATCSFVRAAEILKYAYNGWSQKHEALLMDFVNQIAMPKLTKKLGWTNNWQTSICEARLQIGIFTNNQKEIDWAITEFKRIVDEYVMSSGQTNETLRDLVHAQFGIGSLLQIPELVYEYSQGKTDLFRIKNGVLHKMCEFHAQLLLGKIPVDSGIQKQSIKEPWFLPCGWELAVHHYERRLKLAMPFTQELLKKNRPEKYVFHWGLGTLIYHCTSAG